MKTTSKQPAARLPSHRFAWDRVSFDIPADWELSSFETTPAKSRVEIDDGGPRRILAEWMRLSPPIRAPKLHSRYARAAQALKKKSLSSRDVKDLPEGWFATSYLMPGEVTLITATYLATAGKMYFSFTIESSGNAPAPELILRGLVGSLTIQSGPISRWECYDMAFRLSADFRLAETAFLSGRKQMTFQWRQRRLYVWLISLADMALAGRPVHVWAAEFLNQIEGLRGPRFFADENGTIKHKRRAVWPLGHADQLLRLCFRYKIGFEHHPDHNQIFLWAYHYRKDEDLKKLDGLEFRR